MASDSVNPSSSAAAAPWVVLDTETTGLDFNVNRVIEVAAVTLDPHSLGEVDHRQWLINPGQDTGPAHVHGITNEMVADAPGFSAIAADLAEYLHGKILVAHNLRFDEGFLKAEFARAGADISLGRGFCTYRDGSYASLANSLAAIQGTNEGAHRALNDVRATSTLFRWLREGRYPDPAAESRSATAWPRLRSVDFAPNERAVESAMHEAARESSSRLIRAWSMYIEMWRGRNSANAKSATDDRTGAGTS